MATQTPYVLQPPGCCIHKLPTSCRLTVTAQCCACADRRLHSPSYSKYVDGVGFVLRGTRQETYCWMCKEFWNARIEVAHPQLLPSQTRIPDVPDQTEFLRSWYDYQRGYRIVRGEDGSEERIAVLGEALHDVAPGHLPRSLHELPDRSAPAVAGENAALRTAESLRIQNLAFSPQRYQVALNVSESAPSNQDVTQDRVTGALSEISPTFRTAPHRPTLISPIPDPANGPDRARQAEHQARRISALRRELQRMRTGIERVMSGLQELGDHSPESQDAVRRSTNLDQRLEAIQNRLGGTLYDDPSMEAEAADPQRPLTVLPRRMSAMQQLAIDASRYATTLAPPGQDAMSNLDSRLDSARAELQQACRSYEDARQVRHACEREVQTIVARVRILERERQLLEQNIRIFGSREEVEREGMSYESPIAGMFNRAYRWRPRAQEDERRQRQQSQQTLEVTPSEVGTSPHVADSSVVDHVLPTSLGAEYGNNSARLRDADIGHHQEGILAERDRLSAIQSRLYAALSERGLHGSQQAGFVQDLWAMPRDPYRLPSMTANRTYPYQVAFPTGLNEHNIRATDLTNGTRRMPPLHIGDDDDESDLEEETKGLDGDDGRPAPKSDEEMTLKMECKICYSQIADVAVTPCGHLVMCEWCANQHVPTLKHDQTRPSRPTNCPLCRRRIKQKFRIFRG